MKYTHVRIKITDYERIKKHVTNLNEENRIGKFAQPDIVTAAMDSYEKELENKVLLGGIQ